MKNVHRIEDYFTIKYTHKIFFTENVFSQENYILKNILEKDANSKALIVMDNGVVENNEPLLPSIEEYFKSISTSAKCITIPGGESVKNNLDQLMNVLSLIDKNHIDRHSYLIGIGGGAVLDITGFAAAIAHRGIRYIRLPTTVLAQCDSGVGIKNGLNLFGKKNFIGTFYPPIAVINDFNFLNSLSQRDKRSGLAEVVKIALIKDKTLFEEIQSLSNRLNAFEPSAMKSVIIKCAQLHFDHILNGGDPFETGNSKPLDFGHWSAHKLEQISNFKIKHGEAVAVGIAIDTLYSANTGLIKPSKAKIIIDQLIKLGFQIYYPDIELKDSNGKLIIMEGLDEFREHLGGKLSITLLKDIGKSIEVNDIKLDLLEKALNQLKNYR
ncbi:MAG TPA: 3-dehydroquinate synthase [Verrucomicrobiota bacterium]|nr:3-dehydroquinate synthase [Verrucomicrobiota bacterium]